VEGRRARSDKIVRCTITSPIDPASPTASARRASPAREASWRSGRSHGRMTAARVGTSVAPARAAPLVGVSSGGLPLADA